MQDRTDITATLRFRHIPVGRIEKARDLSARCAFQPQRDRADNAAKGRERGSRIFRKREPGGRNASFRDGRQRGAVGVPGPAAPRIRRITEIEAITHYRITPARLKNGETEKGLQYIQYSVHSEVLYDGGHDHAIH